MSGPEHGRELDEPEKRSTTLAAPSAQRATAGPGVDGGTVPASVERSINVMRSGPAGRLDPSTRSRMESHLGYDLGGVRVHTGANADAAAQSLHARAFTVGNDIFFRSGHYQPGTASGQRLIAHETVHTIQQGGGSSTAQRVQRAEEPTKRRTKGSAGQGSGGKGSGGKGGAEEGSGEEGAKPLTWFDEKGVGVDIPNKTIVVPTLRLPSIKENLKGTEPVGVWEAAAAPGYNMPTEGKSFTLNSRPKRPKGRSPAEEWRAHARTAWQDTLKKKLKDRTKGLGPPVRKKDDTPYYFLTLGKDRQSANAAGQYAGGRNAGGQNAVGSILQGTIEELARNRYVLLPNWARTGGRLSGSNNYHADHILEYQIGGDLGAKNMWLLKGAYNMSVGSQLGHYLEADIQAVLKRSRERVEPNSIPATAEQARRQWRVRFQTVEEGQYRKEPTNYWTKAEIESGFHLEQLVALSETDIKDLGLVITGKVPTGHNIYPKPDGPFYSRFPVKRGVITTVGAVQPFAGFTFESFDASTYSVPSAKSSGLLVTASAGIKVKENTKVIKGDADKKFDVKIFQKPKLLGFGGYINQPDIKKGLEGLEFKKASPMTFDSVGFDGGGALMASGHVHSSKLLLPGLAIPIRFHGGEFFMDFPLVADHLNFGPLTIIDPKLSLGIGEEGFFIQGSTGIDLAGVGHGEVTGRLGEGGNVLLGGEFSLDLNFLESNRVTVLYSLEDDSLTGSAELKVGKDAIPGVQSGVVQVEMDREGVAIDGTVELGGPLTGSTMEVTYDRESGLLIAADNIPVPVAALPGIEDATVSVAASRDPETREWQVGGKGSAKLSAPGASGSMLIGVDGAAIEMMGRADVAKGPATGWLLVHATNLPRDDEGNLVRDGDVGEMQVWGKGGASITFGSILTGSAEIEYTPDGRTIITGDIALPPNFEMFDAWRDDRRLLYLRTPDFPIWGVSVAGVGVGIFASADTEIRFNASVGPGKLTNAHVSATMDLDHPEDATVHGQATLDIPATAGLSLDIGGNLTARAAIAYAEGRIGLEGRLGIDAGASAAVDVDWNAQDGLAIDATLAASATPKFTVGANASLTVGVNLRLASPSTTWGPWRKQLGEFGSGLAVQVEAPVSWSEASGLQFAISDFMPAAPSFDTKSMMDGGFAAVR